MRTFDLRYQAMPNYTEILCPTFSRKLAVHIVANVLSHLRSILRTLKHERNLSVSNFREIFAHSMNIFQYIRY